MRRGRRLSLLVDPVEASLLPALDLAVLEPESNLLLGVLDGVGAVADVAADIDGEVATDGAGGRGGGVGGTEEDTAGLDGVTALPDHGADGAGGHVGNETGEERLAGEVGVVGLEVLLGGGDQLDGRELEAAVLEALDDGADQAALRRRRCVRGVLLFFFISCSRCLFCFLGVALFHDGR